MAGAAVSLPIGSLLSAFSYRWGCNSKPSPTENPLSHTRSSSVPRNNKHYFIIKTCARKSRFLPGAVQDDSTMTEQEEEYSVLTAITSLYNDIVILETSKSRILLLDSTHNIHSIYNKGNKWTGSYWDDFATLPPIIPQGPIAILGLGGGTAAHLMLDLWPSLKLEGWEIDEILIDQAREYLWLSHLEKCNQAGGILRVHMGDALSSSAVVPGGFAGIVVDLFSGGKVLSQLYEVKTWLELNKRLMPQGRIMVNCAGTHSVTSDTSDGISSGGWIRNSTIKALYQAFPGNLSWKRLAEGEGENYLALTGPVPDLNAWSAAVPGQLSSNVRQWRPYELAREIVASD